MLLNLKSLITACNFPGGYKSQTSLPALKISPPVNLPDQEKHVQKKYLLMMGEINTAARGTNLPVRKAIAENRNKSPIKLRTMIKAIFIILSPSTDFVFAQ